MMAKKEELYRLEKLVNTPGADEDEIRVLRKALWGKSYDRPKQNRYNSRRSAVYQPRLCRAFNGIPDQVDRVKSLGNAVVPQQIYPIFKAIMEIERVHYPTK